MDSIAVKKLADTLLKTGLASSQAEAMEKALEALKAEQIIKKAHGKEDYFAKELKTDSLLGEAASPQIIEDMDEEDMDEEELDNEEE